MAYIRADLIKETTTTTGTGSIVTNGSTVDGRPFSAVCSIGDTFPYSLRGFDLLGNPTGDFETGIGTYVDVNKIARTTVQVSSNGNNLVSLSSPMAQIEISLTAADFNGVVAKSSSIAPLAAANGSSLIGGVSQDLATLAALRALSKANASTFSNVSGYGQFYYDATDTSSADNGLSIIVASDGGRWKMRNGDVGPVLMATEGVTFKNGYRSVASGNLDAPLVNAGNVRHWVASYTLNVPVGATIPASDVRHDHVAVVGHSRSQSVNARVWGSVGLAQADQHATTDTEMGVAIGGEFDVNNNTGRHVVDPNSGVDIVAVMAATGGSYVARTAYAIGRVGTSQFLSGIQFGNGTIKDYGIYVNECAPTYAFIYLHDGYTGGGALSVKNGIDAVFLRNAGSTDFSGKIKSSGNAMALVGGTDGVYVSNHADNTVNLSIADNGDTAVRGGFGCNGKTVQPAFAVGAAATDLASVIALANNIRTALINIGIAV